MKTIITFTLFSVITQIGVAEWPSIDQNSPLGKWHIKRDGTQRNQFWIISGVHPGAKAVAMIPKEMKGISQVTYTATWSADENDLAVALFWGSKANGTILFQAMGDVMILKGVILPLDDGTAFGDFPLLIKGVPSLDRTVIRSLKIPADASVEPQEDHVVGWKADHQLEVARQCKVYISNDKDDTVQKTLQVQYSVQLTDKRPRVFDVKPPSVSSEH